MARTTITTLGITAALAATAFVGAGQATASASSQQAGLAHSASAVPQGAQGDTCSTSSKEDALDYAVHHVNLEFPDQHWTGWKDGNHYDPCSALSYILLGTSGGTGGSPNHIALFHNGKFLGTATSEAYAFKPEITQLDPGLIQVDYKYLKDGDATANPRGRTTAWFGWSPAQQKVVMTGQVPPSQ